jgi:hypothetical protein
MGITTLKITVVNPGDRRRRADVECIVDAGIVTAVSRTFETQKPEAAWRMRT